MLTVKFQYRLIVLQFSISCKAGQLEWSFEAYSQRVLHSFAFQCCYKEINFFNTQMPLV